MIVSPNPQLLAALIAPEMLTHKLTKRKSFDLNVILWVCNLKVNSSCSFDKMLVTYITWVLGLAADNDYYGVICQINV